MQRKKSKQNTLFSVLYCGPLHCTDIVTFSRILALRNNPITFILMSILLLLKFRFSRLSVVRLLCEWSWYEVPVRGSTARFFSIGFTVHRKLMRALDSSKKKSTGLQELRRRNTVDNIHESTKSEINLL
jgi:hypothetical protein